MSDSDRLPGSLQENLLCLLTFSDKHAAMVRNSVPVRLFSNALHRDIASRCYEYLDQYHCPPADHLPDLFEEEIAGKGKRAEDLVVTLGAIGALRETINEVFVFNQLEAFVREQSLKGSIIKAVDAMQGGNLELAEEELLSGLKQRISVFSPGMSLSQGLQSAFDHIVRQDVLSTGIKHLDEHALGPARGELHLFIAPPKRGKTWWLVWLAKRAILFRQKVLYITLEISEGQITQRILQALFSLQRRKADVPVTLFDSDPIGRLLRFRKDSITNRLSFDDSSNRGPVEKKLAMLRGASNVVIKSFPTGQLTVSAFRAYLDMLDRSTSFVPDIIIIDYPDLFKINNPENIRVELGQLYKELRGIAVERNVAMAAAKQSNRQGAGAKMVSETHVAEDFSSIGTVDTVITYSQTMAERELGLARLFVSNTRVGEKDRFVVLISQAYPIGQFSLDSVLMTDAYWGHLELAAQQNGTPAGVGGET